MSIRPETFQGIPDPVVTARGTATKQSVEMDSTGARIGNAVAPRVEWDERYHRRNLPARAFADGWLGGSGPWNAVQSHFAGQIDAGPVARTSARRWFRPTKRGFELAVPAGRLHVNKDGSSAKSVGITSSRGTPLAASLGGLKLLPPLRGKVEMGVETRSQALDPHPNLPPARRKEPDRALESCGSVANRGAKTCLVDDKRNSPLVNMLRCVREPERPTISPEEP
jgi:hypothetical protein